MKKIFILFLVFIGSLSHSQGSGPVLSPEGMLEKVFDSYGNSYNLSDIVVVDNNTQVLKSTNPSPLNYGYFYLYLEDGCGLTTSDPDYLNRRAAIGRVLLDLTAFINPPLGIDRNTIKVNIWVRKIENIFSSINGVLGAATSFYTVPYNMTPGVGGIADNEIWKTIHTGKDSYTNVISPLVASAISGGTSGAFYHGMMAFNFSGGGVTWNTSLTSTATFPNDYDLYTVVLHEMTHALGFASLINSTGGTKFNSGYNYYSRYDTFLKNNADTQFLLTNSGCNQMYNNMFNSLLSSSILHPTITPPATYCGNTIRFKGISNVPVYTPTTFTNESSLSHFEDICIPPYMDNTYFVMSDAGSKNIRQRYLKPEERNALGNLGYNLNTTYGISTTYEGTVNYSGGVVAGVSVAGINDGINTNGTYKYIGPASPASPIIINSSTDSTRRIMTNDIGYSGFECLQDVFDSTARFNGTTLTSVSSATNPNLDVTFNTAVSGLHLLRYVPVNGTQKGNITYVYVYVEPANSCGTPTACNLVINGSFEQAVLSGNRGIDKITDACNWSKGNIGTPDYYNNSYTATIGDTSKVPCNFVGYETDVVANNKAYAGTLIGYYPGLPLISEPIKTKLTSNILPNKNYQISFDVSMAEGQSIKAAKIQAYLSPDFTTYPTSFGISISNPTMLFTNPTYITKTDGWEKVIFNFTSGGTAGENTLYLGGLSNTPIIANTPSPQGLYGCSYHNYNVTEPGFVCYYLDNVKVTQIDGTFFLPANLCLATQSIPDLNSYLNGIPTGGVFAGPGVNGFTLNELFDMDPGMVTISYTYTNSSGCSVTVYSNINVVSPISMPSITGSNLAYTTSPNNTTTNSTVIPSGYTAAWTITSGTGTITSGATGATVNASWTQLPGTLTLTLTNTVTGCPNSISKTIYNKAACDCLNTVYFTYTEPRPLRARFTILNSNPNCGGSAIPTWNYGDNTGIYVAGSGTSHTYTMPGTYTVTLTTLIKGANDEVICGGTYSAQVTVIGSGELGKQAIDNSQITLYPNPVSSSLNLDVLFKENSSLEIAIRSVDGKEILRKKWNLGAGHNNLQVELPNIISEGLLFVELISNEVNEIKTIMVKK